MDAELKAKWVAALRSGKFDQGMGKLRRDTKFCCLGVLCVVAGVPISESGFCVDGDNSGERYLALEKLIGSSCEPFWQMNDRAGKPFPEIADYIEKNL